MRFNYILVFLFSLISCFSIKADGVPVIKKIAIEKDTLHSLKGTMYLPANSKANKIVIYLTSVWEDDPHPDFTATKDTLSIMRQYIQHFTDNHIGVLLLTRNTKWGDSIRSSLSIKTLVSDTEKVLNYLKSKEECQKIPIGIMGSSEAGCAAAIVVSKHKDIAFSILMSTPGVTGYDEFDYDIEKRNENRPFIVSAYFQGTFSDSVYIYDGNRYVFNYQKQASVRVFYDNYYKGIAAIGKQIIPKYLNYDTIRTEAVQLFNKKWEGTKFKPNINDGKRGKVLTEKFNNDIISLGMFSPRNIEFSKWDPKLYFPKIKQPVLMLYGEKDINISLKPGVDSVRQIIKDYKLTNFSLKYYTGLDHSLLPYREKKEKRPPGETTPDFVFNDIINWLDEINIK